MPAKEYKVFGNSLNGGTTVRVSAQERQHIIEEMRRSDKLAKKISDLDEYQLLQRLAIERDTKNRVFVIERLYIKFKKARERREKVALLS